MVVLVVEHINIAALKLEGEPPVAVHPDRPTASFSSSERMQAEARQVLVLDGDGRCKGGQLNPQLPGMSGLAARRAARGVEATQPLVADRLDHHLNCGALRNARC